MLQTLYSHDSSSLLRTWSFILLGVDSTVELKCGGCQSGEHSTEYFCTGVPRYLYFRCEGSGSSSLTWNVSSQEQDEIVVLGSQSSEENTIRHGDTTVYVDTVDFTNGRSQIISYLWLNLGLLDSDVTVSCRNSITRMKTLKQLGEMLLTLGAHAQQGLLYLGLCVYLSHISLHE